MLSVCMYVANVNLLNEIMDNKALVFTESKAFASIDRSNNLNVL
jgi:hypothetical protein